MTQSVQPRGGGDRVVEVLCAQGVGTIFTLTGGHISPLLVAAKRRGIRVIDVRDERNAAFAADAMGRISGVPGVAVVTAGPGVTNTLTALTNARLAQSPMVVLGGAAATLLQGRGALQDIDPCAVVKAHVKWACKVTRVESLAPAVEKAFRVATSGVPGPVFVECPIDVLYAEGLIRKFYDEATPQPPRNAGQRMLQNYVRRHVQRLFDPTPPQLWSPPSLPPRPEARGLLASRVAARLAKAKRPVLLVGSPAVLGGKVGEVAAAVSDLGLPTFLTGMARGLLGPDHAALFRHRRREALEEADLVLLAGVPADFRLDYGRSISGRAFVVSINLELATTVQNRWPSLPVPDHPGRFLVALSHQVGERLGRYADWSERLKAREDARHAEIDAMSRADSRRINPIALCRALDRNIDDDATIVADGGDFVATAAYTLRARGPLAWLDPGPFGTLGVGGGFAMASAVARPGRETWLLYGDGAAGFSLMEFDTFARHGLPVIAVVGNDAGWTQIEREQVEILEDDVACRLAFADYDAVAKGLGAEGFRLLHIDDADAVFTEAKALARGGRPVLINAEIGKSDFRKGSISI